MSDEKKSSSAQESRTANADKGGRRRYFWRKKRGQKAATETNEQQEQKERKEQAQNHKRATAKAVNHEKNEKVDRDSRTKRRRRRPRSRLATNGEPKIILPVTPIEDDYVPPKSIFVYTHIVRPEQRDNYEFRAEHFSKVSRRLEDFEIDLSKLFPDEENKSGEESVNSQTSTPRIRPTGEEYASNDD